MLLQYNKKARCGPILQSSCVFWDEEYNTVIDKNVLPCNASVGEVIVLISEAVEELKAELDLTNFNKDCLTFDKTTQKIKDLLQELTTKDCEKDTLLSGLQTQIDNILSGEEDIMLEVDLSCLANEISNCETPPKYSLKSLIQLLINKNC